MKHVVLQKSQGGRQLSSCSSAAIGCRRLGEHASPPMDATAQGLTMNEEAAVGRRLGYLPPVAHNKIVLGSSVMLRSRDTVVAPAGHLWQM